MIEVRCCCKPENMLGYLPEGAPLPLRETEDEDGTFAGYAYSSDDQDVTHIPGFLEAGTKRKPRKTWRK